MGIYWYLNFNMLRMFMKILRQSYNLENDLNVKNSFVAKFNWNGIKQRMKQSS